MRLQPALIEDDYHRLVDLGYYRVGVTIRQGSRPGTVIVHWTVGEPWLRVTANTRYSDPLISIRKGAGITLSGKQFGHGSHLVFATWQSAWTHDYAVGLASPVNVDSARNSEQDVVIDAYGDFEANQYENPTVTTVFNKTNGLEGAWLLRNRSGLRFGIKLRQEHATSVYPSGIMSSAVLPINGRAAKAFLVIAGLSHYCAALISACHAQFRLQFTDGTGAFGSSSEFQLYVVDASRYLSLNRTTTLALRAATTRSGGVVPEQDLPQLDDLRGFRKPFYGTDDEVFQAELRLNDMRPRSIGLVLFTETGAYRFRNGAGPYNPQTFTFNADSGIALVWRGVHVGVAHSREGYFFTVALGPAF
ncbi:MAG TPA: hypothetical protein VFE17_02255 [Candidatus Baltobacteraceae bacterium]|nr:hypothetical protein [Candidatus Baltobacteraceae bacterium]